MTAILVFCDWRSTANCAYICPGKKSVMKFLKNSLLFAFLFVLPFTSLAWGKLGHRIVGEIADRHLSAKARAEVKRILGTESLAISTNWADFIKSDSTYDYLNNWHYINFKGGLSDADIRAYLKKDTAVDVYTRVNFLVNKLKRKKLSLDTQRFYLRLLVHFVGDIHQPLHVGRPDDAGGNRVFVRWFNANSNLHTVWDESLVNFQQLSYTEYVADINHSTQAQRQTWQKATLADWITESYRLAEGIYGYITEKDQKLSYDYNFNYINTVNNQLLKGGVRLAGLLNSIFG